MTVNEATQTIWDYHHLHQAIQPADCLIVLGSKDTRTASQAANLYKAKIAPLMVVSGGFGRLTKKDFNKTEAETYAEILERQSVPSSAILLETHATNTAENLSFSFDLLKEKGTLVKKAVVVTKPYMERRVLATVKKLLPDQSFQVTSPPLSWQEYPNELLPRDEVINVIVGDLQRIIEYPKRGFQVPQEVPMKYWQP